MVIRKCPVKKITQIFRVKGGIMSATYFEMVQKKYAERDPNVAKC